MPYQVHSLSDEPGQREAVAEFLATFVLEGELAAPRPGDDDASQWLRRFRWWWDENPHMTPDAPLGFILEHEDAGIVGFLGYIPMPYEIDGAPLPTLVSTTLFVRQGHRSAVMGMLARQRALARDYQIIDGSPSPEMRRLLVRLGFRHAGDRSQFFFPTRRGGGAPLRAALRALGWSFDLPTRTEAAGLRVVRDPRAWVEVGSPRDGRVHLRLGPAGLSWMTGIGSEPRFFCGLLDGNGEPVAHVIGVYKGKGPLLRCLLLEHREYLPDGSGIGLLLRRLLEDPAAGLDPAAALLVLSRFDACPDCRPPGRRAASILHHHLPPRWQDREKASVPIEGDLALL